MIWCPHELSWSVLSAVTVFSSSCCCCVSWSAFPPPPPPGPCRLFKNWIERRHYLFISPQGKKKGFHHHQPGWQFIHCGFIFNLWEHRGKEGTIAFVSSAPLSHCHSSCLSWSLGLILDRSRCLSFSLCIWVFLFGRVLCRTKLHPVYQWAAQHSQPAMI